jgi:hypothetical protein
VGNATKKASPCVSADPALRLEGLSQDTPVFGKRSGIGLLA